MSDAIDIELLARYLRAEVTVAEARRVDRWIDAEPGRRDVVEALRESWGHAPVTATDVAAAWAKLPMRVRTGVRRPMRAAPGVGAQLWRVAAAVALVVGAATAGVWAWRERPAAVPFEVAWHDYRTLRGERAQLNLPDGTAVLLAPESRLRVPRVFGARRDVELVGAAYFRVAHDVSRPFRVRTTGAVTRVLGTEFGVRRYAGDTLTEVAVRSGRVAVARSAEDEPAAILLAGMRARLGSDAVAVDSAGAADRLGWTAGQLQFTDAPLADVVAEANRWHAGTIVLRDRSLAVARVTAAFPIGHARDFAGALASLIGGRAVERGDTVYLTK